MAKNRDADNVDLEPVYTVNEVADYLKCSIGTVYKLIDSGDIRSARIGTGIIRVTESALREALSRGFGQTDEK